jgi:hypothetical protein
LAFKEWLKALLGEETYRRLDPKQLAHKLSSHNSEGRPMRQLMKTFNEKKRMFHRTQRDIRMDLPDPLHNLEMGDRVVGGEITITKSVTIITPPIPPSPKVFFFFFLSLSC